MSLKTILSICALLVSMQASPSVLLVAQESIDAELGKKLIGIKRIYVESLGEDSVSKVLQSMIINSLTESKRFIVTENKEKADAILKGSVLQKTTQELHGTAEGTSVAHSSGAVSATRTAAVGVASGVGLGTADSSISTETIDHAAMSVRLVAADGDTVWSTTQESKGAKFKGAAADVADKIVKRLLWDIEKSQKGTK